MHLNWLTFTGYPFHPANKVVTLTSGTTYTPTYGARALFVECIGGGGAGGGGVTGAAATSAGSGGGGGALSTKWVAGPLKASYTIAIGAGGTPGAAGNNPGGAGGDTTFDSPSICTAKGGSGGAGGGVAGTSLLLVAGGNGGLGTSGVGQDVLDGRTGGFSQRRSATDGFAGAGADGPWSGSGGNPRITQGAGNGANSGATNGYGAAGGGGLSLNGGASVAGGAGGQGAIRVWEFF